MCNNHLFNSKHRHTSLFLKSYMHAYFENVIWNWNESIDMLKLQRKTHFSIEESIHVQITIREFPQVIINDNKTELSTFCFTHGLMIHSKLFSYNFSDDNSSHYPKTSSYNLAEDNSRQHLTQQILILKIVFFIAIIFLLNHTTITVKALKTHVPTWQAWKTECMYVCRHLYMHAFSFAYLKATILNQLHHGAP